MTGTRYRVPDVLVVSTPFDRTARTYDRVPLIVIEILSPEDRMKESLKRFEDYAELGVLHILQMDPEDRSTRVYRNGDIIGVRLTELELPGGSTIEFDSEALLAEIDQ